jgi:transcription elongation factor Elf1
MPEELVCPRCGKYRLKVEKSITLRKIDAHCDACNLIYSIEASEKGLFMFDGLKFTKERVEI